MATTYHLKREALQSANIDIGRRGIVIGFGEPQLRKHRRDASRLFDAKLNARLVTYFLPAVELARQQKTPPRFYIVSGVNAAIKWNAHNNNERKIMLADNAIKMDFLRSFFERFFADDFLLIEYIVFQDILKISEYKLLALWRILERKHPKQLEEIRFQFAKFLAPQKLGVAQKSQLSEQQREFLSSLDLRPAFKYAIAHLFALGDINFEGNYIHAPEGYISIGGENEKFFNHIRTLAYDLLKDFGELLFERDLLIFDNDKIVLEDFVKVPAYNGMFNGRDLREVTYESGRSLAFYQENEKTAKQMQYMYDHLLSREDYEMFWNEYRSRYYDLKERYRAAYGISGDW